MMLSLPCGDEASFSAGDVFDARMEWSGLFGLETVDGIDAVFVCHCAWLAFVAVGLVRCYLTAFCIFILSIQPIFRALDDAYC